jgi:hypothetical protein
VLLFSRSGLIGWQIRSAKSHRVYRTALQDHWRAGTTSVKFGFVIFPNLTQLDFTGPLQVLARVPQSTVHIVAKSLEPVPSDCGLGLVPTHSFTSSHAVRAAARREDRQGRQPHHRPGGVTSGIDFGLSVSAEIAGEQVAEAIQLELEYNLAPPFSCGHPDQAPRGFVEGLAGGYNQMNAEFRAALKAITRR